MVPGLVFTPKYEQFVNMMKKSLTTSNRDDEQNQIFRDGKVEKLTRSQESLMEKLIARNNHFVSHIELYHAMRGVEISNDDSAALVALSNQFTRKKTSERGLLRRVPEIEAFYKHTKSDGYMLIIPPENICKDSIPPKFLPNSKEWFSTGYFADQEKKWQTTDQSKAMRPYLEGKSCSWSLLFSKLDTPPVRRDIIDTIKDAIDSQGGAIVLMGAGGEGKTTILMQLCVELYREGKTVLFHRPTDKFDLPNNIESCVLIVDNPPNCREFRDFLSEALCADFTVVLASRNNEWNILEKFCIDDDSLRSIQKIPIPKLLPTEAAKFASCVKDNLPETKRSEKELETLFCKDSYGFLYASMLMAINNTDSLDIIAKNIIRGIHADDNSRPSIKILAAVTLAEQCEVSLSSRCYKSLCRALSVDERASKIYLDKEISFNGTQWQTRHDTISKLFYRFLFSEGDWISCDEQEDILRALIEFFLKDIDSETRDLSLTDFRARYLGILYKEALSIVDPNTMRDLLRSLFESCRKHGLVAIDQVFHKSSSVDVRTFLAEKCFYSNLPTWEIYRHWIKKIILNDVSNSENASEYLEYLCTQMDVPEQIWALWATVEKDAGNIGDYNTPKSAAWIFMEGCLNHDSHNFPHLWVNWAKFADEHLVVYEGQDYTPRFILQKACLEYDVKYSEVWDRWAIEEEAAGNIGDYCRPGSAAWIHQKVCESAFDNNERIWSRWVDFIREHERVEDYVIIRNPIKKACLSQNAGPLVWSLWASVEEAVGNIGDYQTPYTAAWIHKECCQNRNSIKSTSVILHWAQFAYRHPMSNTDGLLITAQSILDYGKKVSASFANPAWIELEDFKQLIGYLDNKL